MRFRLVVAFAALVAITTASAWSFYKLASTGESMAMTAQKFLASLDDKQRKQAQLAYNDDLRIAWHFIPAPKPAREGLQVRDMTPEQRKAAFELLKSALSEAGYGKATGIMGLESLLAELEKGKTGSPLRDPQRYYFTVYGSPADEGRWGLSVEGHHLSLNFVVEKGAVISSTPAALGANPAIVMSENVPSIKKGTRILAKEETLAFELLASLTAEQRKAAVIADKAPPEIRAAGEAQAPQAAAEGLAAGKLTGQQRSKLQSLIEEYAKTFPEEVAKARMEAIEKDGLDKVHFAWAGADKAGVGHYYRVQGPTFLIEFINNQPDADGNPANHIHSIWRDMKGDFALPIK